MFSVCVSAVDRRRTAWCAWLGISVALLGMGDLQAEEVTITVADGRSFTAQVDPRSNGERLWLRFGTERTTIQRPIEWSTIVGVRLNGTASSVAELKRRAVVAPSPSSPAPSAPPATAAGGLRLWRVPGAESSSPSVPTAPIRSLDVDVYLANWDADVDSDGIVVNFAALGDDGAPTPVTGTLEVELIGERHPPYSRGNGFPVLGRWVQAVKAGEPASPSGYTRVRLPFQAFHPDYGNALPWFALAHVRLVVPGQGTFEASVDAVRLRGFTPVRDRVEAAAGTRFLPTEQTGRGKPLSSRVSVD